MNTVSRPCLGPGCTRILKLRAHADGRLVTPGVRLCGKCRGEKRLTNKYLGYEPVKLDARKDF